MCNHACQAVNPGNSQYEKEVRKLKGGVVSLQFFVAALFLAPFILSTLAV